MGESTQINVELGKRDLLVVSCDSRLSDQNIDAIRRSIINQLKEFQDQQMNSVLMLPKGLDYSIVKRPSNINYLFEDLFLNIYAWIILGFILGIVFIPIVKGIFN